ncbi:MAG: tRNA (adenosine(37)-N6)-threonylcarbamoyltransferase complex ATPase subunit type 1 TsaE [Deltaproteobacteria bacterium]
MAYTESVKIRVTDRDQTIKLGEIIGKSLEPGSIIALKGDLGAGKTVLVKGIAKGLEIEDEPASPTFVIMNSYEGDIPLYHFDLYRISDADELLGIGYEEFFFGKGVAAVEWADRIEEIFPEYTIYIEIKIPEDGNSGLETEREINIKGKKEWVLSFKNTAEQALPTSTR